MKRILTALLVISLSLAAAPTAAFARAKPTPPQIQTKPTSAEAITIGQRLTAEQFNRFVLPKPPTNYVQREVFFKETELNDFKDGLIWIAAHNEIVGADGASDCKAMRAIYDHVIAVMSPSDAPDPATTASESLESGSGGAFQYNNVLTALLRSQNIPAVVAPYYGYDATAAMYDPSWTVSISDYLDGSLGKTLDKDFNHLVRYITVAFVDGASYYMDPFAGEDAPDTYFDMDFEASLDKCIILPPLAKTPFTHNTTVPAEVHLKTIDEKLIINGHVVEKYKLIAARATSGGVQLYDYDDGIYFFSLQDLATGLTMYSKTAGKTYGIANYAQEESIIIPGLAHASTRGGSNYTNSDSESEGVIGVWYLYYGLWDPSPEEYLTVCYSGGGQVYLIVSAFDNICAKLDILVEYNATSAVINTREPFKQPYNNVME